MLCLGYISRNIYAIRDQEQKRMVCADSAGFPRIRSHFVFCNSGVVGTILNARMEFTLGVSVNRRRGCWSSDCLRCYGSHALQVPTAVNKTSCASDDPFAKLAGFMRVDVNLPRWPTRHSWIPTHQTGLFSLPSHAGRIQTNVIFSIFNVVCDFYYTRTYMCVSVYITLKRGTETHTDTLWMKFANMNITMWSIILSWNADDNMSCDIFDHFEPKSHIRFVQFRFSPTP